ncbi:MAG: glycosyltransferase family 2 protein, partial [Hymenobacter sp.]
MKDSNVTTGPDTIVSVIIPTFNRVMFIGETLDSVVPQLRACDEIIVIDDGSTDGTSSLIRSGKWPVHYIRQENAGKSAAVEKGIAEAKGGLIWIVDDDDIMA